MHCFFRHSLATRTGGWRGSSALEPRDTFHVTTWHSRAPSRAKSKFSSSRISDYWPNLLPFSVFSWYFGVISRREAEEYLMAHTNPRGTFLIRESEQNPGGFALSIKDWDQVQLDLYGKAVLQRVTTYSSCRRAIFT